MLELVKATTRVCYLIFRKKIYLITGLIFFLYPLLAKEEPAHIPNHVWEKVKPYLLPEQHPARVQLDRIFSRTRGILNLKNLERAGFKKKKPRKFTHLIVTTHPSLPGYIFKLYLDSQKYYKKIPEHENWLMRIHGAALIQNEIDMLGFHHFFKVPKKWIYDLPEEPSPPPEFLRKNFILIEEDMALYSDAENINLWQSDFITQEILEGLFIILKNVGLRDCVKIDNIPIAKDGKIAFVDTQSFHAWPVPYKELLERLSLENKSHWKSLIKNQ